MLLGVDIRIRISAPDAAQWFDMLGLTFLKIIERFKIAYFDEFKALIKSTWSTPNSGILLV